MPAPFAVPCVRVGWFGPKAEALISDVPDLTLTPCDRESIGGEAFQAYVVDSACVSSLAELRNLYERFTVPVLLLVAPSEAERVLSWVRSSDDVCLKHCPAALIRYRLRKLLSLYRPHRDSLTGLRVREDFLLALDQASGSASRELPVSVIFIDLDHFKLANDRFGHPVGDEILKECGRILLEFCGEEILAARFGGEEFSLLLREPADAAFRFAESIREAVSRANFSEGLRVTCSLGVSTACEPMPQDALFRQADEALYAAKAHGRNQSMSYSDLERMSQRSGDDVKLTSLQNRARVLVERAANWITLRSKRIVEDVQAEAETDGLTQFYTRRSLDRRLLVEFEASNANPPLTVALVDVDHFGQINKRFGWPTGDKILQDICRLIRSHVRGTDWIGRYGGEEFCIVMPQTSLEDARDVLERLRIVVQNANFSTTKGEPVQVTLSIGATTKTNEKEPAELIERASALTLKSKQSGRNRLMVEL